MVINKEMEELLEKKIYVELSNNRKYQGVVKGVKEEDGKTLVWILDKFGKRVCFNYGAITFLQEEPY